MAKHDRAADMPGSSGLSAQTHCLFCGSDRLSPFLAGIRDEFFQADPGTFDFMRCEECLSLVLSPRPVGERLERAYASYYTHDEPPAPTPRSWVRRYLKSAFIKTNYSCSASAKDTTVVRFMTLAGFDTSNIEAQFRFAPPPPARILDYGCGSGEFLMRLAGSGYDLVGAEFDAPLIRLLKARHIDAVDVEHIDEGSWADSFDHVTLAHVLEHVADPRALLARLSSWLKSGATLYVELPNADATGLKIFGRYWRGLEAPRHFALPTRASLLMALGDAGFDIVRQKVRPAVRTWMWQASLDASPPGKHDQLRREMTAAATENEANAEFLTVLARKI